MSILINASAAKYGGAKAIVEKFVSQTDFGDDEVYLIGPKSISFENINVKKINVETNGIYSLIFSTVFILYYVIKYGSRKLISFNNLNLIFPVVERVTYFHMPHTFYKKTVKHKIYRFVISKFLCRTRFVVQTNFVKDEFSRVFGFDHNVHVNWPGCQKPDYNGVSYPKLVKSNCNKLKCLVPIMDTKSVHKNFRFLEEKLANISGLEFDIFVTSEGGPELPSVNYIGVQERSRLNEIYHEMDFMIFPSIFETVGLPIFEFSSLGKPVLVLERPYIEGIKTTVEFPSNIVLFDEADFFEKIKFVISNYESLCSDELSLEHSIVRSNWNALTTS